MKLLLSSLLLASLCALSSWSVSSGTFVVTQTPDLTSVMEGETVNISCCWSGQFQQLTVNWLKNQTQIKNESSSVKKQSLKNETSKCSTLVFSNITAEDSGRYICKVSVEIPVHVSVEGHGTIITVTNRGEKQLDDKEPNITNQSSSIITALAVVCPLFLIALVCLCILRRKEGSARVIYEVPHVDSDVVEMDKRSTGSSTGSSQWCQVPVYESFDYFEHMQPNKETG